MRAELHCFSWCEFESDEVEMVEFLGGEVAFFTSRCPSRVTSPNDGAACLIEVSGGRGLLAIADGVGGQASGYEAARCVIESLVESCFDLELDKDNESRGLRSEVLDAIEFANREILNWGIGAATTLTAVELAGEQFRHFHVGDSAALVTSNRGNIKFATIGHAPIAQAVESGLLDEEEALGHEDNNLITNCLGSADLKVEIGLFQSLAVRDTLLVASDGLFDNVSREQVARTVCKGELRTQVSRLVNIARKRMTGEAMGFSGSLPGKEDDLTLICFRPSRK